MKFKQVSAKQSVFATCWRPLFLENRRECPKNYPQFETTRQKNPQAIPEKAEYVLLPTPALNKTRKIGYKISKKRYTPVGNARLRIGKYNRKIPKIGNSQHDTRIKREKQGLDMPYSSAFFPEKKFFNVHKRGGLRPGYNTIPAIFKQ